MIRRRARRKWKSTPFALIVGETGAPNTQLRQYAATKARWGETRGKLKMSETNGGNDLTFSERLRALEASHVKLMTDLSYSSKPRTKPGAGTAGLSANRTRDGNGMTRGARMTVWTALLSSSASISWSAESAHLRGTRAGSRDGESLRSRKPALVSDLLLGVGSRHRGCARAAFPLRTKVAK
jgi:hypothetical protein